MADPAEEAREEKLMRLASAASESLVSGLASFGLLDAPEAEPARVQVREKARHLFLFVAISVLLEEGGKGRADAERLKDLFALELLDVKKQIRKVAKAALTGPNDAKYARELEKAAGRDPFAPYYGSFDKMRKNPQDGPFAIFARRVCDGHLEERQRRGAYDRVFMLAAELSDRLIERIGQSAHD